MAQEFFVDYFTTALDRTEILTEVRFPMQTDDTRSAYVKLARREGDIPLSSAAVALSVDTHNVCRKIRLALGAANSIPMRARGVEAALLGKKIDAESVAQASQLADQETDPPSDIHGSREYRKAMTKIMTKRAIMAAIAQQVSEE